MTTNISKTKKQVSSDLGIYIGRITKPQKAPEDLWLAHTVEDSREALSESMKFFFRAHISGLCSLCLQREG